MIFPDTSAWIEFFSDTGSPIAIHVEQAIRSDEVGLGDLVAVEVLQGIRSPSHLQHVSRLFNQLDMRTLCGPGMFAVAATNHRALRQRGVTIRGMIDVIIATWCIENGARLLHNDRDFDRIAENLPLQILS